MVSAKGEKLLREIAAIHATEWVNIDLGLCPNAHGGSLGTLKDAGLVEIGERLENMDRMVRLTEKGRACFGLRPV
jgi:hypothetical protein